MCNEKGLEIAVADKIGELVRLNGSTELIEKLLAHELSSVKKAKEGLESLKLMFHYAEIMNIKHSIRFDMSLARGLDYYTGLIYEVVLTDGVSEVGSIAAGGRYDGLVSMLADNKKQQVPCVGISIGIERLFNIINEKMKDKTNHPTQCYVISVGKQMTDERLKLVTELWKSDIRAEHSYKANAKILNILQSCEEKGIPYAIIIGEDELKKNIIKLRVVKTREEQEIPRSEMADVLKKRLLVE